jgi:hypothetical protein
VFLPDLLHLLPPDLGSPGRARSPAENLTGGLATFVLPIADFLAVLFGELYRHPAVAIIVLPAASTVASLVLARWLRTSTTWTVTVTLACAALCFIASGGGFLLGLFLSFYSEF